MLPLLPALLLLILQGPCSIERMAVDGRLPVALEAIQRQLELREDTGELTEADEAVLASIMAFARDAGASTALLALFNLAAEDEPTKADSAPIEEAPPPIGSDPPNRLLDGFARSQRSRDGPH